MDIENIYRVTRQETETAIADRQRQLAGQMTEEQLARQARELELEKIAGPMLESLSYMSAFLPCQLGDPGLNFDYVAYPSREDPDVFDIRFTRIPAMWFIAIRRDRVEFRINRSRLGTIYSLKLGDPIQAHFSDMNAAIAWMLEVIARYDAQVEFLHARAEPLHRLAQPHMNRDNYDEYDFWADKQDEVRADFNILDDSWDLTVKTDEFILSWRGREHHYLTGEEARAGMQRMFRELDPKREKEKSAAKPDMPTEKAEISTGNAEEGGGSVD